MHRVLSIALAGVATLGAFAASVEPAIAQSKGKGGGDSSGVSVSIGIVFTEAERHIVHEYYGVPAGVGGGRLPPGQQKRLARGKPLPPGIAKKALPDDLDLRLGPPRAGTSRIIIGNDLVLIEVSTGFVLDVIEAVAGRR